MMNTNTFSAVYGTLGSGAVALFDAPKSSYKEIPVNAMLANASGRLRKAIGACQEGMAERGPQLFYSVFL